MTVRSPLACALVLVAVSVGLTPAASDDRTPFERLPTGLVVVPVTVDGRGPYRFLLDTGSTHSMIATDVGLAVGAVAVARAPLSSSLAAGGEVIVARVERFSLGPYVDAVVYPSVVPRDALSPDRRIDGLIGQDVLSTRRFTIDYAGRWVRWFGAADPMAPHQRAMALREQGGRFVLDVPYGPATLRLVPDSGSEGLVLFAPLPPSLATPTGSRTEVVTLTRRARAPVGQLFDFSVGDVRFHRLPAVLVEHRRTPADETDGLLPLSIFGRVSFDGPARQLIVEAP